MARSIGRHAAVIGAGMGGLAAAKALSGHFAQVTILERDALPDRPEPRPGTPQSRHGHALLAGGQAALDELFPRFTDDIERAGAVRVRMGLDTWWEWPGYDPFPVRDLGTDNFCLSRPLIEFVTRVRIEQLGNIVLRQHCRVLDLVASDDKTAVIGVHCADADGIGSILLSDLVVDASGRGALTVALLEKIGSAKAPESEIGIDVTYASAVFEIPRDAPPAWKGLVHVPLPPENSRAALILPMEDSRWIVSLAGRHGDMPPGDLDGFIAFTKGFRTSTIHNALVHAKPVGEIARFGFPCSTWRHYDRLERFPRGLLPIADAICRFNPAFGQGMSVAAQEACVLNHLLGQRCELSDPLDGLAQIFFAQIQGLLDAPWSVAENDFMYPQTRGERPVDFDKRVQYGRALRQLAAQDPLVHRLMVEVSALLRASSALSEPGLAGRVAELMKSAG